MHMLASRFQRIVCASLLALAVVLTCTSRPAAAQANTFTVVSNGASAYRINGVDNPTLNLQRGQTYTFNVSAFGHPFYIKTEEVIGSGSTFDTGVTNNGTSSGTLTFSVPMSAPATLYYQCSIHDAMKGTLAISGPGAAAPAVPLGYLGLLLLLMAAYAFRRLRQATAGFPGVSARSPTEKLLD